LVSEASVYRLLKAHDLIASPAFIVMKAADEFKDKTTAPNQLWQTDFTYLKVIGWGWFYLSTVLDDFSRYIIAWKLCTTMKAETSPSRSKWARCFRARQSQGAPSTKAVVRQRSLVHLGGPSEMDGAHNMPTSAGSIPSDDARQDRALAPDAEEPHPAGELLPTGDLEAQIEAFVDDYNRRRYHESIDNLTPADVYFGRGPTILLQRERIKRQTITARRLQHQRQAA